MSCQGRVSPKNGALFCSDGGPGTTTPRCTGLETTIPGSGRGCGNGGVEITTPGCGAGAISEPVASTTFWAASGIGLVLTGVCAGAAPLLARGMNQPDLTPYVLALAPLLIISMVSNVSEAFLLRALRFRWVYTADIANIVLYAVSTIVLATLGLGAWSMVWGRLLGEAVASGLRLATAGFRPRWTFRWAAIRADLRFNGGYLASTGASFVSKNIDYWAVTYFLGTAALGAYYVAFVLPNILRQRMTWLASEILFPVMARAKHDRERLIGIYRDSARLLAFVAQPILFGVALTAEQVIGLAFGPQWHAAVQPMRFLALAAVAEATVQASSVMFLALGKPGVVARMLVWRILFAGIGIAIALPTFHSITAVAVAIALSTVASDAILLRALDVQIGVGALTFLNWIRVPFFGSACMAALVIPTGIALHHIPLVVQAIAMGAIGAIGYLGGCFLLDRPFTTGMLGNVRGVLKPG